MVSVAPISGEISRVGLLLGLLHYYITHCIGLQFFDCEEHPQMHILHDRPLLKEQENILNIFHTHPIWRGRRAAAQCLQTHLPEGLN